MFDVSKHKALVSDLPLITDNYLELLSDENPILYTGTNKYGNRILGTIVEDDDENEILRYFHIIIDNKSYYDFINRSQTLLSIMKGQNIVYVIDKKYNNEIADHNIISYNEIPSDYLPLENSYCPTFAVPFSLNYGISLKGKKSDLHKAEVNEVNNVQTSFSGVLKNALLSLTDLELNPHCYLEPAETGSFRVNFNIELENRQISFFPIENEKIADYITKYLDYIVSKLPNEKENVLKTEKIESEAFKNVEDSLIEIYNTAQVDFKPIVLEQKLVDSINETAIQFEELSNQIKESSSFNLMEVFNYTQTGAEFGLGSIDEEYFKKIKNKLIIEEGLTEIDIVEEDSNPKKYRILVYQLNIESGKGSAMLFYGEDESFDKVSLHIDKNDKSISNSIYSNSLNEEKVVEVKGISRKINGKYKLLKVTL